MLKMAKKIRARALDSEKRAAAAAAEVAAEAAAAAAALAEPREPPAPLMSADPEKTKKNSKNLPRGVPSEKFPTEKERRKLEKKLLEQRRKEEKKKEKERKKLEKIQKKKGSPPPEADPGPEVVDVAAEGAAEGAAEAAEGAGAAVMSRAWAAWDSHLGDGDDAYYTVPRVGGVVWRPGPPKGGALRAHLPLLMFLVFSVRSPSWVLNFLLQKRTERGRGCGFMFGATCCRTFLGCAFFSYWSRRTRRRRRARSESSGSFSTTTIGSGPSCSFASGPAGSSGSGQGAQRRGHEERLI